MLLEALRVLDDRVVYSTIAYMLWMKLTKMSRFGGKEGIRMVYYWKLVE